VTPTINPTASFYLSVLQYAVGGEKEQGKGERVHHGVTHQLVTVGLHEELLKHPEQDALG